MMTTDEIKARGFFGPRRVFSNFHMKPVHAPIEGMATLLFPSSENAYMACKCPDRAEEFLNLSPLEARRLGQTVPLRADWEQIKFDLMKVILIEKFSSGPERAFLEEFQRPIVEFNYWHDNYWGDCRCIRCTSVTGHNHLGRIITGIRNQLLAT